MSYYLKSLNPEQFQAASIIEGPVLVFAGAGSGKTKTVTHRIAYMIEEKGIDPSSICAVSFTNKAADEMKERLSKLVSKQKSDDFVYFSFSWNKNFTGKW